mmetsp:Transcript_40066/g.74023  ORF Transcript_40066/g.74023 Transcript_40066/m.74023 type:complete len:172 (+) Transcript_40066:179-694(+)
MGQDGAADGTLEALAPRNDAGRTDDFVSTKTTKRIQHPILQNPRFDRLTVFQAAPLVWRDKEENLHTVEMLEFDREREILSESMKEARAVGAEIELVFEPATTDRLGAFLAANETQVLHFTCHGLPEFLGKYVCVPSVFRWQLAFAWGMADCAFFLLLCSNRRWFGRCSVP